MTTDFKPALIIVDVQEDFCPPNGSLAVSNGRSIIPTINRLLSLPFVLKIATQDWHPVDHISFASNHDSKKPFVDTTTITNRSNLAESCTIRLWPDHCIQDTPGAELLPELDVGSVDHVVKKGTMREVEMYSGFCDPFGGCGSGLVERLREGGVTDVFVVGLAFDYCVKATALDAAKGGFKTVVVREGTKAVDPEAWGKVVDELRELQVEVVGVNGEELGRVKELKVSSTD
ncbi:related to pyrazinamidase/nicotinamidase [Rhynchosporium secalis]|uniref:nicotinamidase n=1 Tax=Rhynchosporium secalis TaxID=38038 RepID=A0A1E1MCZ0_RHYSE|nr:related to pyrazinamidase/nicotinamidase [Rhynchosporium secalis]